MDRKETNKIIVAHPGRQHSFRLATALKKNDMLLYYVTTIYNKKSSRLMQLVQLFLSKDNLKRANNRKNSFLKDTDVIQYCEFRGMVEALLVRIDKSHRVYRFMQRHDSDRFGVKVAKLAIKENVDAVVMYDSNATAGFRYLKKKAPNIVRILDVSIAPRPYIKRIYQKEIQNSGNNDLKKENAYLWQPKHLARSQSEIDDADYFLAASQFVKEGLIHCGAKEDQIKLIPYGANVLSNIEKENGKENAKCKFLFVGQVNYRKGIPYLLDVISEMGDAAELTVVGAYNPDDWFVKKYKETANIHFTGLVTFDKMQKIYEQSDVFIIPSFAEGMAQVGIEAMACGLPIICTFNSGVSDLVEEGKSGFIIPCGDKEALKSRMTWFLENKLKIYEMGRYARNKAIRYTWEHYEDNVVATINQVLNL